MGNAKNPGGYYVRLMYCDPYADDRANIKLGMTALKDSSLGFNECRANAWFMYSLFKREGTAITTRNCSKGSTDRFRDYTFKLPTEIKINNVNICKSGKQCCEMFKDTQSGTGWAIKKVDVIQDYQTVGGCTDITKEKYGEAYICSEIWPMYNCNTYFSKGKSNARLLVRACYDLGVNFLSACKLFKTGALVAATFTMKKYDTEEYLSKQSASQLMSMHSLYVSPDRVCHPYSYYFPESIKKTETPPAGGASASGVVHLSIASALAGAAVMV